MARFRIKGSGCEMKGSGSMVEWLGFRIKDI